MWMFDSVESCVQLKAETMTPLIDQKFYCRPNPFLGFAGVDWSDSSV